MGCMRTPVKYIVLCALISTGLAAEQDPIDPDRPPHIVGGEDVTDGEFPFVAKIIYYGRRVGCTGSLIASDKVLTAKHCVNNYSLRALSVSFGNARSEGSLHRATHVSVHPFFSIVEHDLAIIQFAPPVSIQPVPLLILEEELKFASSGERGMAVGWGSNRCWGLRVPSGHAAKGCRPDLQRDGMQEGFGKLTRPGKTSGSPRHLRIYALRWPGK